jgi:hypothetical protein
VLCVLGENYYTVGSLVDVRAWWLAGMVREVLFGERVLPKVKSY